jgi:hypothetical protein
MAIDLSADVILRWDGAENCAALLEPGGIDAVWLRAGGDAADAACRAAGAKTLPANGIRLLTLEEAGRARTGDAVAIKTGVWPGARSPRREGDGAFVAGATQRAWVDANGFRIGWLRAVYPECPPVLGYLPDSDAGIKDNQVISRESLELALVDCWCAGGNYILAPDAAFREALLRGDAAAMAAWKRLGRTARWLKEQRALFRQPMVPAITALVDAGEETAEIANLLYRHGASADLVSAARVPPPDPARRAVVVAASLRPMPPASQKALLAHAAAGATVVTDAWDEPAWWRVPGLKPERKFEDREFYTLGSGRIVAYKGVIADPGDFALDVIDLAGARRPVRLWTFSTAIAAVSQARPGAKPVLRVVDYGSRFRSELMVHVAGVFGSATLLRPGISPAPLRVYRRGGNTEVVLPGLERVAVVVFG